MHLNSILVFMKGFTIYVIGFSLKKKQKNCEGDKPNGSKSTYYGQVKQYDLPKFTQ